MSESVKTKLAKQIHDTLKTRTPDKIYKPFCVIARDGTLKVEEFADIIEDDIFVCWTQKITVRTPSLSKITHALDHVELLTDLTPLLRKE